MDQSPKAVIDTSVLIAGVLSQAGGSTKILSACRSGKLVGIVSNSTRNELERNAEKIGTDALANAQRVISESLQEVIASTELVDHYSSIVDPDDAHLLAVGKQANAAYLVSLNRKHLLENETAKQSLPFQIVSPKELIQILEL